MSAHGLLFALGILLGGHAMAQDFVPLDRAQAAALGNAATHGAPTAVALWSYECVHCKGQLERLVRLQREHPQLRILTVAVEPAFDGLAAPLERIGVVGPRFAYGDAAPEALAHALDPAWRGELPRTVLFDGRGGRVARSGPIGEDEMRRLLGLLQ